MRMSFNMRQMLLFVLFLPIISFAQVAKTSNYWKSNTIDEDQIGVQMKESSTFPLTFSLQKNTFQNSLSRVSSKNDTESGEKIRVDFPNQKGEFIRFELVEKSSFSDNLKKKYPNISSFYGTAIHDPKLHALISYSKTTGLHVSFQKAGEEELKLTKTKESNTYILYKSSDIQRSKKEQLQCDFIENLEEKRKIQSNNKKSSKKKSAKSVAVASSIIYKMALGVTGDLSNEILGGLNISSSATEQVKKEGILSWLNVIIQNTNYIFNRDVGIQFELIDETDQLIFLDPNTDTLSHLDKFEALDAFPSICENNVGFDAYEISHLLGLGGGGVANSFGLCDDKTTSGVTLMTYNSDPYIGTFSHEIGHQFTAGHTFNNCPPHMDQVAVFSSVEPGSGSTIMSYNGICNSSNVPDGELLYFHSHSVIQMREYIESLSCGSSEVINRSIPTVSAGLDYIIPANTPFLLVGSTSDTTDESLSFTWSQMDKQLVQAPPVSNSSGGPLFRWVLPTDNPLRYFPNLETLKKGELQNTWEVLPSVSRQLNFNIRVRDNASEKGTSASDAMKITVDDTAGPFQITSQNQNQTWYAGSKQLIEWDVANTDQGNINSPMVDLYFSVDDGQSFTLLAETIPNDGKYILDVPFGITTTQGRILIQGHNNIFIDINNAPITIKESNFYLDFNTTLIEQSFCSDIKEVEYSFQYKTLNGYNQEVDFNVEGLSGTDVSFNPAKATSNSTTITLTISNITIQKHVFNVITESNGIRFEQPLTINVNNNTPTSPSLVSPLNGATSYRSPYSFEWEEHESVLSYSIEISAEETFENVVVSKTITTNKFSTPLLEYETTYYWRVQANNSCGAGSFSNTYSFTTQSENEFNTYIPDDAFEQAIINLGYDSVLDDYVENDAIKNITSLDLYDLNIKDASGIEGFINLTGLTFWKNQLTEIDLTKNINLTYLDLEDNQLTTIDLSKNNKLEVVYLSRNQLSEIDLSNNFQLGRIYFSWNNLTEIDLTKNLLLESIDLSTNNLTEIDLSKNHLLENIDLKANNLNEIDLSKNIKIKNITLTSNRIEKIDLSKNSELDGFILEDNLLTCINLYNQKNVRTLNLSKNKIETLNLSNNTNLEFVFLSENQLKSLNLKSQNNHKIRYFDSTDNPSLSCIAVDDPEYSLGLGDDWIIDNSTNFAITCEGDGSDQDADGVEDVLDECPCTLEGESVNDKGCSQPYYDSDFDGIDNELDSCPNTLAGEEVNSQGCALNQLTYIPDDNFEQVIIDLGLDEDLDDYVVTERIESLKKLDMRGKNISNATGIEDFIELERLVFWENSLTQIDLSQNIHLTYLDLDDNKLEDVDLSKNTQLTTLYLNLNNITCLDLNNNLLLLLIHVLDNKIEALDLSNHKQLYNLNISNNRLKYLNLKNGTNELINMKAHSNPDLRCIEVDDTAAALNSENWSIDRTASYSVDCDSNSFDQDQDGIPFESDACPCTANGVSVNVMGCALYQLDSDNDGITDDIDQCPATELNSIVDINGCALNQIDSDEDGITDDVDQCPNTLPHTTVNDLGCALYQLDTDNDGVNDAEDQYNNTPENAQIDINGGVVISSRNLIITGYSTTCPDTNTGKIEFTQQTDYTLDIGIEGVNFSETILSVSPSQLVELNEVPAGTYEITIDYTEKLGAPIQNIIVNVNESEDVQASKTVFNKGEKEVNYLVSGSEKYALFINEEFQQLYAFNSTAQQTLTIELENGINNIRIEGDKACQSKFTESLYIHEGILVYPNPSTDRIFIEGAQGIIQIFNINGRLLHETTAQTLTEIDVSNFSPGVYLLKSTNQDEIIEIKNLIIQ